MAFPRIPRRWRLRTLMVVVALAAATLTAYREYVERGPVYWQMWCLRTRNASDRSQAALRIGLLGPRASFAIGALTGALDDPDLDVRTQAMYALVRLGSRSSRLLPDLVAEIEHNPPTWGLHMELTLTDLFGGHPPRGWPLSEGGLHKNDPIEALKLIWPDASPIVRGLRTALKDPNDCVRSGAREALYAVATWSDPSCPELAEELIAVLADDRRGSFWFPFENHKRAVNALARLDHAAQGLAVKRLADDLRDVDSLRSYEAALLLPRLANGADAAVAVLRDQVAGDDEIKRAIAVILLESLGERAVPAAPTLLQVIAERDTNRTINPSLSLGRWHSLNAQGTNDSSHPRFLNPLPVGETSTTVLCVRTLRAMGEPVARRSIRELIGVLRDPDRSDDRKRGAIIAVGEFGPGAAEAIPALVGLIRAREKAHREPAPDAEDGEGSPGALAAEALGSIGADGNPEIVAILGGLLEARDPWIRRRVARALKQLGPKAKPAVPALAKALKSPYPGSRSLAAAALGAIGGPEVRAILPALIDALDDEDRGVRGNAASILVAFGSAAKEAVPKMVRQVWNLGPGPEMVRPLGQIGPDAADAVPALLVFFDGHGPPMQVEIRQTIERIIPRTPGATIAGSIAAMKQTDPAGRVRATFELGRLIEQPPHPAEGVTALAAALGDPDPPVRRMAAAMLCRLGRGAAPAGPALFRAARDPDESVRKLIIVALGRTAAKLPWAVPALTEMLKDESGDMRRRAAVALSWIGPDAASAAPAIIAVLDGPDNPSRPLGVDILGRLVPWHEAVVPVLLKAREDPSDEVRMAAVSALGQHVNARREVVLPALLKAMNDPSGDVRYQVSWWLGTIRPARIVIPTLIEKLKEGEPNTRKAAAGALGHLGGEQDRDPEVARRAVKALAAALADRDPAVRSGAAWSLMMFGHDASSAEPALRAAMNDPSRHVRDGASAALQQITANRAGR